MARRKNTKRIDPRYFLHESAFLDGVERLQQKYGVRVMVSDTEGRYGVSVVHRKEDRLPGDDPQFETYDDLEQAEADIISRRKQQKMEFEPSKLEPKSHREKAPFNEIKEELRDYYGGESHPQSKADAAMPRRGSDDQQSYEMAMDASRQTVMDIFGEDVGSMAWELITTALHAEPGSFEGVMNLHQEIADLKEL